MRRKILLFAVQFIPLFVVCLWLYPRVLPLYQAMVIPMVNVGLERFEPPMRMEVMKDGGWRAFERAEDGTETFYWSRPGKYLHLTYLGLALLPALLLATPVALWRRLRLFGLGMLLLLLLYVPAALGLVWSVRCLYQTPGNTVCMTIKTVVNVYGQLMSLVLWGLLTWDVWLHRVEPGSETG